MVKEELLEFTGIVKERLPNAMFKVGWKMVTKF